jgi:ABC-type glycerol-3-phosphate transport system substrate-binding protein/DNA-binding transcriptional regulator YhcF (GntR family)
MRRRLLKKKKHVYDHLLKNIRTQIQNNTLKQGDCIRTENELCLKYKLSRVSVRAALRELVKQGLLYRKRGKGTFVANGIEVPRKVLFINCPLNEKRLLEVITATAHAREIPVRLSENSGRVDISFSSAPLIFSSKNLLLPLNQFLGKTDVSRFFKVMWDKLGISGLQYGVPCRASVYMLYYNKDLFDNAARKYPDNTWDWETLAETAESLYLPDKGIYGYGIRDILALRRIMPFIWQNRGGFFENKRASFCTPAIIEAIKFYNRLAQVASSPQSCLDLFLSGRIAMCLGSGELNQVLLSRPRPFKWGITRLARGKDRATALILNGYFLYKECLYPELAWKLINELVRPDAFRQILAPALNCVADRNVQNREGAAALCMDELPYARTIFEDFLNIPQPAAELAIKGLNKIILAPADQAEQSLLQLEQAVNLALESQELTEIAEN